MNKRNWIVSINGRTVYDFPVTTRGGFPKNSLRDLAAIKPAYTITREPNDFGEGDIYFEVTQTARGRRMTAGQFATGYPADFAAEVSSAIAEGLTYSMVVAIYGICRQTVHNIVHKFA